MRGKKIPEQMKLVALIGARRCSGYGERMAEQIGRELADRGIGVVSGLARGIDGIAQWAALAAGGYSVGVPGCGVDICYPRENKRLYERCAEQGLLLSEYAPGTEPKAWNFPARNRIISGLSGAVIVVEAREKSGTLITVDMALEQGREVFAVPGRLTDLYSVGCNGLIGQGAALFTSVDEMLAGMGEGWERADCEGQRKECGVNEEKDAVKLSQNDSLAAQLLKLCDYYPKSVMELFSELKTKAEYRDVTMVQVIEALLELTVSGRVFEKGQNYYYRRN